MASLQLTHHGCPPTPTAINQSLVVVDRQAFGRCVVGNACQLMKLEAVIHLGDTVRIEKGVTWRSEDRVKTVGVTAAHKATKDGRPCI
jgi:hypothetical protein